MTYTATTTKRLRTERGSLAKKLAAEFELIQNSCNHQAATLVVAAHDSLHPERADYVCGGADDQVEIQAAIDASEGDIYFSEGNYIKGNVAGITVPSNRCLRLSAGATITFKTDVGDGAVIFENEDAISGNSNISIIGGVLNGNKANQAVGEQTAIKLRKVTQTKICCAIRDLCGENIDTDSESIYEWKNPDFPRASKLPEGYDVKRIMNIGWEKLSDFENAAEWAGETAADTSIFYSGSQSLRKDIAGGSGVTAAQFTGTASDCRFDATKTAFRLKFRCNNPGRVDYARLRIYAPDISNMISYAMSTPSTLPADEWVTVYGNNSSVGGSPDFANIVSMVLYFHVIDGPYPVSVWVDKLESLPPLAPNGVITFGFDGGDDEIFTDIVPIMREYGIPGVMYPTPYAAETIAHIDDLKELQKDGWDILAHSMGGYLHTNSRAENEYSRMKEIDYMLYHGFTSVRYGVAPLGGTTDDQSVADALEYYYIIRKVSSGASRATIPPALNYYSSEGLILYAAGIEDSASMDTYKTLMDETARTGAWLHMYCHRINTVAPASLNSTEFRELIDYANTKGLTFTTVCDVMGKLNSGTVFDKSQVSDIFMDVLAVSATHVRSNEDLSAATPITFTIDAQPDVPRTLSWSFDSHAQITEYDMEVIGVDAKGNTVTETWDETAGWSGETSNAFATITTIKMTSRTGTGAADTMDIGITDVLGLSNVIYDAGDVFKIKKNNANATAATAQVNTTYDTYDMSVIGLGAADDFTIWYKSNLNIIS